MAEGPIGDVVAHANAALPLPAGVELHDAQAQPLRLRKRSLAFWARREAGGQICARTAHVLYVLKRPQVANFDGTHCRR